MKTSGANLTSAELDHLALEFLIAGYEKGLVGNKKSAYWKGKSAKDHQAFYRDLLDERSKAGPFQATASFTELKKSLDERLAQDKGREPVSAPPAKRSTGKPLRTFKVIRGGDGFISHIVQLSVEDGA